MSARIIALPTAAGLRLLPGSGPSDPGSGPSDDAALVYAVEQFLAWRERYLGIPLKDLTSGQQHRFGRIIEAWEDRILETDATTIRGVRAKLRYLLSQNIDDNSAFAWIRSGAIRRDEQDGFSNLQNGLWELIQATACIAESQDCAASPARTR